MAALHESASSMEIDNNMAVPPTSMGSSLPNMYNSEEYSKRPDFVRADVLRDQWQCSICKNILLQPHQTVCAKRVCWPCMDEKFDGVTVLKPCPLNHEEDAEDSDDNDDLPCQVKGLLREHVTPDPAAQRSLLKEKVHCENKDYGCERVVAWRKLKDHLETCEYKPIQCKNEGCIKMFSHMFENEHLKECEYSVVACQYCGTKTTRGQLNQHYDECPNAESTCHQCGRKFINRRQLNLHQQVSGKCVIDAGRCAICDEEFDSKKALQRHLDDPSCQPKHFQAMAMKAVELKYLQSSEISQIKDEVRRDMKRKVDPIIKTVAESALDVKKLKYKVEASVVQADTLENSMKEVNKGGQVISSLKTKVESMERLFSRAGLEQPDLFLTIRSTVKELTGKSSDFDKRLQHLELATYDGTLIWKISEYKKRKQEAIRGRQTSIYSHPFYSSKTGYKMCGRVYLNGDGAGKNRYLSIFFVLMKGEYDDLISWPFRQRVTFSLLAPRQPQANHTETFMPDPDSTSFQKPHNEMNVASGCPQFLLQSEVESSQYLHLELATYDGTLIWKISEYKKRKQEAIRGRQTSIYSHPFYSSKTGYKMCGRVCLTGDGASKNRYLSIFFVLMKGEYDDLISWPFRQRVTFSLLAPRQPQANHTETFTPDPDSTSFQKPRNEMNVTSGCPQFLLQSEVESSHYLVNDRLYIKVKVEPGGDTI